ncbi:MAG: DUF2207 domain-containing protein [Xanthomonadales bacterium]|nr:DUF2207 domain-containing protein [Xanthomonadales bacterium]
MKTTDFATRLAVLLGLFLLRPAFAEESIIEFHADVQVHADASLTVNEYISVRSEGRNIRRGIYRDFPIRYKDRFGNRYDVRFNFISLTRNDSPEPSHLETRAGFIRIYFGSSSVMLENGVHRYQLQYRTRRQLGFFDDYDELYWNVTGNDWAFPIERASARVSLPSDVAYDDLKIALYTGQVGQRGNKGNWRVTGAREIRFESDRALAPGQGLTVAVGWPKGLVEEPGAAQRLAWFFSDNKGALVLLSTWLLALAWYLQSWNRHGRDPRKGVIIPRFEPPEGISAAASQYVLDMGMKSRGLTAAIVSLGIKGHLRIDEQDDDFVLFRTSSGNAEMTEGESAVLSSLLPEQESWIELDNEKYREFQSARTELEQALKKEHKGRLFKLNTIFMIPAIILSILGVIAGMLAGAGPLAWVVFAIVSVAMHITFLLLLRAPTPIGRQVMDEIEGFRMYLETAEQDRLERMRSSKLTPEVFEMFLPYAFALGVENSWCKRLERELPRDAAEYQPAWYSGHHGGINTLHHLGDNLGSSFSSAISSAATAPGSSSGSGGGGFSGGGGGGGGGGGW